MEEEKKIKKYKLSLLGDHAVGKTYIFNKISKNSDAPTLSTIGVDKRTINYNDIDVNINGNIVKESFSISLFDTAGQERFKSITKNYILGSDGIILIYDITKRDTFLHVEKWLNDIKDILSNSNNSDYIIMLLGNKLDLVEEKIDERTVQVEEGQEKCKNLDIYWGGECSAKNFTQKQFLDLFENFVTALYTKIGNKQKEKGEIISEKELKPKKKKCC